jgi:hypothetical protein
LLKWAVYALAVLLVAGSCASAFRYGELTNHRKAKRMAELVSLLHHIEMKKSAEAAYESGFREGKQTVIVWMGDAIPLQSADGGCVAVSPSRHEVVGAWPRSVDGQCNLADWRAHAADGELR